MAGALRNRCTPLDTARMTPGMAPVLVSPITTVKAMRSGMDMIIPRLSIRMSSPRRRRLITMLRRRWAGLASRSIGRIRTRIRSRSHRRHLRRMFRRIWDMVGLSRIRSSLCDGVLLFCPVPGRLKSVLCLWLASG